MYVLLPLSQLLQSGPYPHTFTKREVIGPYCPKDHEQCEKTILADTKAALIFFLVAFYP